MQRRDLLKNFIGGAVAAANPVVATSLLKTSDVNVIPDVFSLIEKDPNLLQYVVNPSKDLILMALRLNGSAIEYVKDPTEEMMLAAVTGDPYVIDYIDNPPESVQLKAVSQGGAAISCIHGKNLSDISLSDEVKWAAVKNDPIAISDIEDASEAIKAFAVENLPTVVTYIKNPSMELQVIAVKKDPNVISYMENPSKELQIIAVSEDASVIRWIRLPCEEAQLIAIKKDKNLIDGIKKPSKSVKEEYKKLYGKKLQKKKKLHKINCPIIVKTSDPKVIEDIVWMIKLKHPEQTTIMLAVPKKSLPPSGLNLWEKE